MNISRLLVSVTVLGTLAVCASTADAQAKGKKSETKKGKAPAKVEQKAEPQPKTEPAPAPAPVPAAPRRQVVTRVAVYDMSSAGDIKPRTAVIVSEAVLAEIRKLDGVSAVGMKEIMEMLAFEQKKQFVGCDSVSCLVELAGALGVDELVTGNLGALGDSHVITIKRMDLASAETKKSVSKNLKKGDGEEFLAVVGDVTKEMFPDRKYKQGATPGVTKEIVRRLTRPPLPRWVFFTTAGLAAAAAGTGAFFSFQARDAHDDYLNLVELSKTQMVEGGELRGKQSKAEDANSTANISFIVAGALAAAAVAEIFFTDWHPETERPTVTPVFGAGGTSGVVLSWAW
ncbi:MAG: hypothetical protein HY897_20210 [Deltaproteobacteria bacterium]|nr:hypothetical protein [Deltaproteobacteria bacterium]